MVTRRHNGFINKLKIRAKDSMTYAVGAWNQTYVARAKKIVCGFF